MALYERGPLAKRHDEYSTRAYNERYHRTLESYVRERYPRESYNQHLQELQDAHPNVARTVIENHTLTNAQKWRLIMRHFQAVEGEVVVTVGKKGAYKTTFNWDLAQQIRDHTGRPVAAVGDPDQMPEWAVPILRLNQAPKRAVIVADELAILFGSRASMQRDNRRLGGELAIIRQNENILLGIVQNLSMADKHFIALADSFIIKPLGLTQMFTEREGVGRMLKFWKEVLPRDDPRETLFISKDLHPILVRRDRPAWLATEMSRAYQRIPTRDLAIQSALRLAQAGFAYTVIVDRMSQRGWHATDKTWKAWLTDANGGVDPRTQAEEEAMAADRELASVPPDGPNPSGADAHELAGAPRGRGVRLSGRG